MISLDASHTLNTADVVPHAAQLSLDIPGLVATAPQECVGKRAGGACTHQLRINQPLIALARQGTAC